MTVEAPRSTEPTGGGIGGALTKKLGPLPAWGWGVAIGGGFILLRIVRGKSAFPSGGGSSTPVGAVTNPTIPGTENSALGGLSASDLAALAGAVAGLIPPGKAGPAGPAGPAGKPGAPSTSPPPATKVDFAGTKNPFGTVYPTYVHTYAEAIAWIKRAIANGAKPKSSINIAQTPVK